MCEELSSAPNKATRHCRLPSTRATSAVRPALVSAAVALELEGGVVREARIGLGGVAAKPWRSPEAEAALRGKPLTEATANAVADAAFSQAVVHGELKFKPELGRRTLVRALLQAQAMEV
jgi:xanthine dehydrogenase YagS FAD-binding subunit